MSYSPNVIRDIIRDRILAEKSVFTSHDIIGKVNMTREQIWCEIINTYKEQRLHVVYEIRCVNIDCSRLLYELNGLVELIILGRKKNIVCHMCKHPVKITKHNAVVKYAL